ncbi:ATP-binding region ATPase domain protein [Thalassoporum mexicanum PCC 7367]|uniref:molecular chaperone HtpG n=1 Tax=Thalassoporum mexicanum TaxID=3457544 RepID=UPI00029F94D7|nr:molecular chaperone HtpG [Pseudanabaena sp. PCC 7367]AFY70899.1 ATP-binding region ATPase domain protein [Pseudanabaena sp. PCC 7367]
MAEKGNITIHTENIFPIIKKALYSDRDIFLRELISNGVDAISKLKMVSYAGETTGDLPEPEINVTVDKEAKTITIADNGIGMTADEVKKYINQVAFSSAEEFVQKYTGAKDSDQQIIGHFGLGFYSSFMVASKVEIDTLSYQADAKPVRWSCDGTTEFELDDGDRTTVGTTITLHLQEDAEEFLDSGQVGGIIRKYCDFMPVKITLDGNEANKQKALWDRSPREITKEEYLEFYRYLYPFQEDPLFWIHLNTDYPFIIKGILYFPKIKADIDPNKGQIKLFSNHVFVSDNCEEVIPRFLLPLRGAIDSTDIPLNVSRSFLQGDRKVRRIQDYIAKKVADHLKGLFADEREEYLRCWQDIAMFMKFGSINNDKFYQQIKDILIYPSSSETAEITSADYGNYTTLSSYLERNKERHENRVFYTSDAVTQSTYVELHKNQGLEVITLDSFIDSHFVHFLEREYTDVKFSRVDAEIDPSLISDQSQAEVVDPTTNQTKSDRLQELFRNALDRPNLTIRTESLKVEDAATSPPAMILLPEEARRMQEMAALLQQTNADFPADHILLVNTAHPLVDNLLNLDKGSILLASGQTSESAELADMICKHVYDLALMAQKSFDAASMQDFLHRSHKLLTSLTSK